MDQLLGNEKYIQHPHNRQTSFQKLKFVLSHFITKRDIPIQKKTYCKIIKFFIKKIVEVILVTLIATELVSSEPSTLQLLWIEVVEFVAWPTKATLLPVLCTELFPNSSHPSELHSDRQLLHSPSRNKIAYIG